MNSVKVQSRLKTSYKEKAIIKPNIYEQPSIQSIYKTNKHIRSNARDATNYIFLLKKTQCFLK